MPIDPSARIAHTARVHPDASIGAQTVIGEFCIVEQDTVVGQHCIVEPYVYIKRWTSMGDENAISAGTVLGTDPLDKNFKGERSYLRIGHRNRIREHYTISRGTQPESETVIGDDNYIMTSGHIAHNAVIGNHVVIASCALVAGYVVVEDRVFLSGGIVAQQYSRIGKLAMVGGGVRVNRDVPPFFIYGGVYATPSGLNVVGLKRSGYSSERISSLKQAYRLLYSSGLKLTEAIARIESEIPNEDTRHLTGFLKGCKKGIARPD
jgi:UDP-N-acetylglucosamine acyltransferase